MQRFSTLRGTMLGLGLMAGVSACSADLDITNPNNPDVARALASGADVVNIANSSLNSWYLGNTHPEGTLALLVTADALTANYGNFGMRFNNVEPRIPYDNSSASGDRFVTQQPWDANYGALGAANDALRAIASGTVIPGGATGLARTKSIAQFTQALALTHIGLTFDKGFIVDEAYDPAKDEAEMVGYKDVLAGAMKKWDALIAATNGQTFTIDATVMPVQGGFNATRLNRIANTMAAITLAYGPRNPTELAQVDWAKVAAYTDKGIGTGSAGSPFNWSIVGDANNWYDQFKMYGALEDWVLVDQRVMNLMDPNQPVRYTGTTVPRGTSPDARYESDFAQTGVIGDPNRGIWMQSPWSHSRYSFYNWYSPTYGQGAVPWVLAAESDLLRAEALIRTNGNLATAASLINTTRVGRGKLPAASASEGAAKLMEYINYEREIELLLSNSYTLWWKRGRDAGLQPGTFRHLPIPARELETLKLPVYTFGGVGSPVQSLIPEGGLSSTFKMRKMGRHALGGRTVRR